MLPANFWLEHSISLPLMRGQNSKLWSQEAKFKWLTILLNVGCRVEVQGTGLFERDFGPCRGIIKMAIFG